LRGANSYLESPYLKNAVSPIRLRVVAARRLLSELSARVLSVTKRVFLALGSAVKGLLAVITSLAAAIAAVGAVFAFIVLIILLFQYLRQSIVVISEIDVPPDLVQRGYSQAVAQARFHDALVHYYNEASSKMHLANVEVSSEEPNVNIPAVGLPFNFVADSVAPVLHVARQRVSGELTESHARLWLQLRLNDRAILVKEQTDVSPRGADALFAVAAQVIFESAEPFVAAAHVYTMGHEAAARIITSRIINSGLPASDVNVIWAHVISGVMLLGDRRYAQATTELGKAISEDSRNAVAHNELGRVYFSEGDLGDAANEYAAAIALDDRWAAPVLGLGDVYSIQGKVALRDAEYQAAIPLEHR
jgi:tetratricopeptide (TPR) repeat protein